MVKQSPLQSDLFDFSYIEEQIKEIKKSSPTNKELSADTEQSLRNLFEEQSFIIKDLEARLEKIENTKQKRKWF